MPPSMSRFLNWNKVEGRNKVRPGSLLRALQSSQRDFRCKNSFARPSILVPDDEQ